MAGLLDTPSRVLRRVQQYEDMELPSLPSFQQDDFDDDMDSNHSYSSGAEYSAAYPSASVLNDVSEYHFSTSHVAPNKLSPSQSSDPSDGPTPKAPIRFADEDDFSSLSSTGSQRAARGTAAGGRNVGQAFNDDQSVTSLLDGDVSDRYEDDDRSSLSERLPPVNSDSEDATDGGTASLDDQMDTPGPRRLMQEHRAPLPSPHLGNGAAPSGKPESRIPSLSRSELSGTDNEATTPNGSADRFTAYEVQYDLTAHSDATQPHALYEPSSPASTSDTLQSPAKPTPTSSQAVTPVAIRYMDEPSTAARAAATPFGYGSKPLGDVTPRFRNRMPTMAMTPSVDYSSTPRALLDDKERRKSHVLSVLASASLPSRVRNRGTPHPLRRVSIAPHAESISEDHSASSFTTRVPVTDSPDVSSVSIASSQDLATDRKGQLRYQRGNTSVPDILMSTGVATPAWNQENRPDAIKIQKHLNMMNKQLLDSNADLAREAEEWRQECNRLIDIVKDAGIDIDYDGLLGDLQNRSAHDSLELPTLDDSFKAADVPAPTKKNRNEESQALRRELQQKDEVISSLRSELSQVRDRSKGEISTTNLQLELDEAHRAHANLQSDFAKKTQEHVQQFTEICHDFEEQVKGLEAQLAAARSESERLRRHPGRDLPSPAANSHQTEDMLKIQGSLETALKTITDLEHSLALAHRDAQDDHARIDRISNDLEEAEKAKLSAQEQARSLEVDLDNLKQTALQQKELLSSATDRVRTLEATANNDHVNNEVAYRQLQDLKSELDDARTSLAAKEMDIESLRNQLAVARLEQSFVDQSLHDPVNAKDSLVIALEDRLDEAHRDIGRLRHDLNEAPARQTIIDAQDARIQALETEKASLMERLRSQPAPTPGPWANSMMTSTPMVHKTLASLRGPKTPGPMKEFSWLHTTIGDSNESMMRVQLDHLQQELDIANSHLDKNFGRLEAAGLGAVQLAQKLAEANDKVSQLEEQVHRLSRETQQSRVNVDNGISKNQRLEAALADVRHQMSTLQEDAVAERERLRDETHRLRKLNSELQAKSDEELQAIARESEDLYQESQKHLTEERDRVEDLRRTKARLESDLRTAQTAVSRLEKEHASLLASTKEVARPDHVSQERSEARHQAAIHALQECLQVANDATDRLRTELSSSTRDLDDALHTVETLRSERARMTQELSLFAQDLRNLREECSSFGHDLRALRQAQRSTEANHAQQVSRLDEALQSARHSLATATRQAREAHQRASILDAKLSQQDQTLQITAGKQRQKYKVQTRRLSAQIDYLKAKYTRENTFRNALALQKKFLLLLVGGMSLNEQATLRVIASMGLGLPAPPRPKRTLKAAAIAVLALVRARRAAEHWQGVREAKTVALS